jgi:preprotein translocase subunit SecG
VNNGETVIGSEKVVNCMVKITMKLTFLSYLTYLYIFTYLKKHKGKNQKQDQGAIKICYAKATSSTKVASGYIYLVDVLLFSQKKKTQPN